MPDAAQNTSHFAPSTGVDTRQTLMEVLKHKGEADVNALSEALGISGVAVRQHLAGLERDGLITQRAVRRPVGRPAKLYRLTDAAEEAFPQGNDIVALDLLRRLESTMGAEAMDALFEARLGDLEKQYGEQLKGADTWEEKLKILARLRDEEGYLCSVEAAPDAHTKGGLQLVEHHCPIAAIARQHPQVCRYEKELFRRVLGEPELRRVKHIKNGDHACAYEVPAKSDASGQS